MADNLPCPLKPILAMCEAAGATKSILFLAAALVPLRAKGKPNTKALASAATFILSNNLLAAASLPSNLANLSSSDSLSKTKSEIVTVSSVATAPSTAPNPRAPLALLKVPLALPYLVKTPAAPSPGIPN